MSDASRGFKMVPAERLADKLREKHQQDEGTEVGASGNPENSPWFCAARINAYPSISRGSAFVWGTAAAGRVHSRTTDRRHEWQ